MNILSRWKRLVATVTVAGRSSIMKFGLAFSFLHREMLKQGFGVYDVNSLHEIGLPALPST